MAGTPDRLKAVEQVNMWDFLMFLDYGKTESEYRAVLAELEGKG